MNIHSIPDTARSVIMLLLCCALTVPVLAASDAEFAKLMADARQEFVDQQSPTAKAKPLMCPFMAAVLAGEDPIAAREALAKTFGDVQILSAPFTAPEGPTNPMGVAQGIFPGRVVWDWDPTCCTWDGMASNGAGTWATDDYWWDTDNLNQAKVDQMVANCLVWLTGQPTTTQAWDAIFAYFNMSRGLGSNGYQNGEGIAIKPNMVNCWNWSSGGYDYYDYIPHAHNRSMTSRQVVLALLKQLVNVAGVPQEDISVYIHWNYADFLWDYTHGVFPAVHYWDYRGAYGREQKVEKAGVKMRMSNNAATNTLPTCLTDSKYLINCPALKTHEPAMTGSDADFPTLCAKNHFGSALEGGGSYHPFIEATNAYGRYHILPDLMEHEHQGGKTLLYVIDGTAGGIGHWDSVPLKWFMTPFGTNWPNSILMSLDPCAIDSVGLDFVAFERALHGDPLRGNIDSYLHEASQITNPPSGTVYDPDDNGPPTHSLGVHEHWTDANTKNYTRNLGTGTGIELFTYEPLAGVFSADTPQILPGFNVCLTPDTTSHGSLGRNIQYWWDVDGDGTWDQQGIDLTATATYAGATGLTDVRMLASNAWGETVFYIGTGVVDVIPPVTAGFSAWPTNGQVPLEVTFTDLSANSPQFWFWDFEGSTSTQRNPVITFTQEGIYTVTQVVSNDLGAAGWSTDTEQEVDYIIVVPEPFGGCAAIFALLLWAARKK
jgi:hypothetical protein